jgi:hypothetical protein
MQNPPSFSHLGAHKYLYRLDKTPHVPCPYATLVFCGGLDLRISPPGKRLPRVNASRFQFGANCMHVVELKRVAMQLWWKYVAKSA